MMQKKNKWITTRRDFLKTTGGVLIGLSTGTLLAQEKRTRIKKLISFGMVTDPHSADVEAKGSRYYKESVSKMAECVELMNDKKVDFLIELGDFKDMDDTESAENALKYLDSIESVFKKFDGPAYHVIGNHDVDCISKEQFLNRVENTGISKDASYYSFDAKGLHFIVLDANYLSDGSDFNSGNYVWTDVNIPEKEMNWLKNDLASTSKPVVVFVHELLDGQGDLYVNNAKEIRQVLQKHQNVLAVFQGHHHSGDFNLINDIYYYTLKAMVEGSGSSNSSYAIVDVYEDYSIAITGYRKAENKNLSYTK